MNFVSLVHPLMSGDSNWLHKIDDDGNATIRSINYKCKLDDAFEIECSEFISKYAPRTGVKFPELHDYPQTAPCNNSAWIEHVLKSKVANALDVLTQKFGVVEVVCRALPRAVFADAAFKVNECVLVPTTTKVRVVSEDNSDVFFSCEGDAPEGKVLELMPSRDADMSIPAWLVATTTQSKEANMKVSMVRVEVDASIAKKGKTRTASSSSVICVPVLVNKKGLNPGDELTYYRSAKATPQQALKRPFGLI